MLIKIILLLVLLYLLYKAFGGEFKLPKKKSSSLDENDENTLVECCKCEVYITQKEAVKKGKLYYCQECKEEI